MPTEEGFNANMSAPTATLAIKVIRANGKIEDLGIVSEDAVPTSLQQPPPPLPAKWKRLLMKTLLWLAAAGLLSASYFLFRRFLLSLALVAGLVTTAGINYLMADFLASSVNHISAFNYHDCGTGTTAATIADTALETPTGGARVSGTQSTPVAGQYRSVATIPFSGSFAITEWGLFSAASGVTLWDRRVFSPVNVGSGDFIQFTYTVTGNAGGS
jgi:hypothetical protein